MQVEGTKAHHAFHKHLQALGVDADSATDVQIKTAQEAAQKADTAKAGQGSRA